MSAARAFFQKVIDSGEEWYAWESRCCSAQLKWTPADRLPAPPQANCSDCGSRVSEFQVVHYGGGQLSYVHRVSKIPPPRRVSARQRALSKPEPWRG
jgi:hypothetical protein